MNIKKLTLPDYVLWEIDGSAAKLMKSSYHYCTVKSTNSFHPLQHTLSDGWYLYEGKTFFRCLNNTYLSHDPKSDLRQFKWELDQLDHKHLSEFDSKLIRQLISAGATIPKRVKRDLSALYYKDLQVKSHNFECNIIMKQGGKKRLKALREKIALIKSANPWKTDSSVTPL